MATDAQIWQMKYNEENPPVVFTKSENFVGRKDREYNHPRVPNPFLTRQQLKKVTAYQQYTLVRPTG